MSIITDALNKETSAYKCWYNYNYGKNTLGISDADYARIIGKWKDSIGAWSDFAKDENKYEISDSELSDYKAKGKQSAKDATGYAGGGKGKMIGRAVGDAAMVAGSYFAPKIAGKVGEKLAAGAAKKASQEAFKNSGGNMLKANAASDGVKTNAAKNGAKAGIIVACAMSLATGILSKVKKANKEQKEACDTLKNEVLPEAQGALADTQDYMEETEEELLELSEEAEEKNEEANDEIEEKKTDFDAERRIYDNLMSKKASGEPLSEDEQIWLKEHAPLMAQISDEIDEISEDTSDEVNDLYDQMGEKEENYDEAAESIAEVDGIEDYAESFDSTTKTMCYVEGGIQAINATMAGVNAARAVGAATASTITIFGAAAYWAAAAAAAVGAALSGVSSAEQFKWAGEVGQEIDLRKETQAMSDETTEAYDEKVEVYEGTMGIMEDMELEIPDDLEVPEGVTTEGEGSEETQPDTGLLQEPAKDDDGKKKKEE